MDAVTLFVAGLVLLIFAAELVVRHGSSLALALGMPPVILGLTFIAIGTSAPELAVGITAVLEGNGALAVGNIAGTNMVNILLILGLSASLRPLVLHQRTIRTDLPVMIATAFLLTILAWDGTLSRLDGIGMIAAAVAYTVLIIRQSTTRQRGFRNDYAEMFGPEGARTTGTEEAHKGINTVYLVAGVLLSVLGANWLVDGAVQIASDLGLGEAVIGLTIVAIGTSAPELVTTIVGTLHNERDVAVGNLIGSSIYNILAILGITCLVAPAGIPVERELLLFDIPLMSGVALLCLPVFITGGKVSRAEGGLLVSLFCAYEVYVLLFRPGA